MINPFSTKIKQRVVVTGIGMVSSIGFGRETFWKNLTAGQSGISKIESLDTSSYDRHYAGEIKNFDPQQYMSRRRSERIGRTSQMAVAASHLAIQDSGYTLKTIPGDQTGVFIGTTMGENMFVEKYHDAQQTHKPFEPYRMALLPSRSLSVNVALKFRLNGPNAVFTTACASGNYSIGRAYDLINYGSAHLLLAGGADSFTRTVFTGFSRLLAIAPEKCQPFDKDRKGMIPGEGAAMLLIEALEHALQRQAHIYAEVLGYGLSCDAYHMTQPKQAGIANGIQKAVDHARVEKQSIDYYCAHGTGTAENDKAESGALHDVFGEYTPHIPVSSIKSMLGHTMGAASAFESAACCLAIKNKEIPPNINLDELDPECDINVVANKSLKKEVRLALNNASAFGGNNCCVVFGKYS